MTRDYRSMRLSCTKHVLEAIPIIAGDSRHDELCLWLQDADRLIREIEKDERNGILKPCPFCGGRAELFGTKNSGIFYVKCLECDVDGNFDTPEEARAAWNRRISND